MHKYSVFCYGITNIVQNMFKSKKIKFAKILLRNVCVFTSLNLKKEKLISVLNGGVVV